MRRKKLLWQLYPTYLLIILVSLLAVGWYALSSVREFYFEQKSADLEAQANLVRLQIISLKPVAMGSACHLLEKSASMLITLIDPSGKVICDSKRDVARMDNHADRTEFKQALARGTGSATRFSNALNEHMMYQAILIKNHGQIIGVVRTSVPITSIDLALGSIQIKIALGGLLVALLAAAISLFTVRRISRPLEEIKKGAQRFAEGDLVHKVPVPDSAEMGELAEVLNKMAKQLNDKIQTATAQRNEKEAILSGMTEGVLVVDAEKQIISLNKAAARLMDIHPQENRYVGDVVRNVSLQKIISQTLSGHSVESDDIVLSFGNERFIQVRGAMLRDARDRSIGALIVLNDVTRLRRLENTRRDFVANVSHEIKTPITAIKGFVETLLAGAMLDPDKSKKFLEIVVKQADHLNAIIEDLLSLSRIEQESECDRVVLEETGMRDMLLNAIKNCGFEASEQNVKIELVCETGLTARVNPPLLEQAVINLIDNALKYSDSEKAVEVKIVKLDSQVDIQVRDWGCGIDRGDLPRLFERFFRVDKGRSREVGGTGLGLAIVKHIAQAHGGSVSVASTLGEGSSFFIHLPQE